jgi:hypothetical protein
MIALLGFGSFAATALLKSQQPQRADTNPDGQKPGNNQNQAAQFRTAPQVINALNKPEKSSERNNQGDDFQNRAWNWFKAFIWKIVTDPIAFATALIALLAAIQINVYRHMRDHAIQIERAYVGFGTKLIAGGGSEKHQELLFTLKLHNFGNTPARIERLSARYYIDYKLSVGAPPDLGKVIFELAGDEVFLVKGGDFTERNHPFPVTKEEWDEVNRPPTKETRRLWLLGFIEYRDRFLQLHLARYARVWDKVDPAPLSQYITMPKVDALTFATTLGYNTDIELCKHRKPKEHCKSWNWRFIRRLIPA